MSDSKRGTIKIMSDKVGIGEVHRNVLDVKGQLQLLHEKMDDVRETQASLKTEVVDLRHRTRSIEGRQWQTKAGLGGLVLAIGALVKLFLQ